MPIFPTPLRVPQATGQENVLERLLLALQQAGALGIGPTPLMATQLILPMSRGGASAQTILSNVAKRVHAEELERFGSQPFTAQSKMENFIKNLVGPVRGKPTSIQIALERDPTNPVKAMMTDMLLGHLSPEEMAASVRVGRALFPQQFERSLTPEAQKRLFDFADAILAATPGGR